MVFLPARYIIYRNSTHMNNYIFHEKSSEATFCAYTQPLCGPDKH